MLITLMKKGYFLGLIIIIAVLSARSLWKCEQPVDRLLLVSGFVIVGYNGFLFLIYVGSFGEADALRVASFWRYNMHLGAVVIAVAGILAVSVWRRYISSFGRWRQWGWVAIILLVASPMVFAKKLRFDLNPMIQHYRYVGAEARKFLSKESRYFVLDPAGSGESYNIAIYELNGLGKASGYMAAYHKIDRVSLARILSTRKLTHILVHSVNPVIKSAFSVRLRDDISQLLRKQNGAWVVAAAWPLPANRSSK